MTRIVFDIGGTNLRVARADGVEISEIKSIPSPEHVADGFEKLSEAIETVRAGGATAIVGGIAGIISRDGAVGHSPNLSAWQGFPLGAKLRERFGPQVFVGNDADMAGIGEARLGAGVGARIVAYIGAGTGVGGTLVVDSFVVPHTQGFEPGHQIIEVHTGERLEERIGGRMLSRAHGVRTPEIPRAAWDEASEAFAVGLWNTVVYWSPEVIVLGGSLMNEDNGFRIGDLAAALKRRAPFDLPLPELRRAALGNASGLYGAAVYPIE